MAHNSDYTKIWDPPGIVNGLSVDEAAHVVDEVEDIGACCASDNINKWAKYKPQRLTEYPSFMGVVTLAMRKADNFGFDPNSFRDSNSMSSFITRMAAAGYDWAYLSRVAPYRLLDFSADNNNDMTEGDEGYNVNAVAPYSADGDVIVYGEGEVSRNIEKSQSANAEIDISELGVITEEEDTWYIGIFTRHSTGDEFVPVQDRWGNPMTLDEAFSTRSYETARPYFKLGRTDMFWGLQNEMDPADATKWIMFPNTHSVVTVGTVPVISTIWLTPSTFSYEGDPLDVQRVRLNFDAANNSNLPGTLGLIIEIAYYNAAEDVYVVLVNINEPVSVRHVAASVTTAIGPIVLSTYLSGEELDLNKLYIKVGYNWRIDGGTTTWWIDLDDTKQPVATEPANYTQFVSLI